MIIFYKILVYIFNLRNLKKKKKSLNLGNGFYLEKIILIILIYL